MDKIKFTFGKFSFPVFFLQPTVPTVIMTARMSLKMTIKISMLLSKNVLDVNCQTQDHLKLMTELYVSEICYKFQYNLIGAPSYFS
jgi:hypothetical protein